MNRLEDLLHDVARDDHPLPRVQASDLYAAGRRRYRRRMWVRAGAATAVVLVTTVGVAAVMRPERAGEPDRVPGSASASASRSIDWAPASLGGTIVNVRLVDDATLYAQVSPCADDNCPQRLLASTDGGRTWQERYRGPLAEMVARGPQTLSASIWNPSTGTPDESVSTDGGKTWSPVVHSTDPVAEVPDGGWLSGGLGAGLAAGDGTTFQPLKNQPGLQLRHLAQVARTAGLWVAGTTADGTPAIAVSHDRGRTWTVRTFADFPHRGYLSYPRPVVSADGRTAYVTMQVSDSDAPNRPSVYRTGDGGATWTRVDTNGTLPAARPTLTPGYIAADGTHIVSLPVDGTVQVWASRDNGTSYTRYPDRPGLPADLPVSDGMLALDGKGYVTGDGQGIYRSPCGLSWTRIATA